MSSSKGLRVAALCAGSIVSLTFGFVLALFVAVVATPPAPGMVEDLLGDAQLRDSLAEHIVAGIDDEIDLPIGDDALNKGVELALKSSRGRSTLESTAEAALAREFGEQPRPIEVDLLELVPEPTGLLGAASGLLDVTVEIDPTQSSRPPLATLLWTLFAALLLAMLGLIAAAAWKRSTAGLGAFALAAGLGALVGPLLARLFLASSDEFASAVLAEQLGASLPRLLVLGLVLVGGGGALVGWSFGRTQA